MDKKAKLQSLQTLDEAHLREDVLVPLLGRLDYKAVHVYHGTREYGKDIVCFLLEVNGFEVFDLGIDQPEENFVEAVKEHHPQVLALSGFLSVAFDSMKSTVQQVEAAGLRKDLKIIIGGGQMDETVRAYTGADAYGDDAMAAVAFAKKTVGVS